MTYIYNIVLTNTWVTYVAFQADYIYGSHWLWTHRISL